MSDKVVTIYTGAGCEPCAQVKKMVEEGDFQVPDHPDAEVEFVDIGSDEGFKAYQKHEIAAVPTAIDERGKKCAIEIDEEAQKVIITCEE